MSEKTKSFFGGDKHPVDTLLHWQSKPHEVEAARNAYNRLAEFDHEALKLIIELAVSHGEMKELGRN